MGVEALAGGNKFTLCWTMGVTNQGIRATGSDLVPTRNRITKLAGIPARAVSGLGAVAHGILLTVAVGGADVPVTIALLNS